MPRKGHAKSRRSVVLVVEDDPSWQMNYEEILEEEEYLVEVAASKEEADRKLRERTFDVAIVDLRLVDSDPKNMDGIEFINELRAMRGDTHVIVISGYLTDESRQELEESGVFGVLGKGEFSGRQLLKLVAKAVYATQRQPRSPSEQKPI